MINTDDQTLQIALVSDLTCRKTGREANATCTHCLCSQLLITRSVSPLGEHTTDGGGGSGGVVEGGGSWGTDL